MTNTQTTTRTKLSLPKNAANTRAAMKAGEGPAIRQKPGRKPRQPAQSIDTFWIESLASAGSMHRDALQYELAVGLSYLSAKGDADKATPPSKKGLREVYASAGWACDKPTGEDYKTVSRRIGATADLYVHLGGRETIETWIDGAPLAEQISAIVDHVKKLGLKSIYDVLAHVGKPVVQKRPRVAPAASGTGTGGTGSQDAAGELTEKEQLAANAAQAAINSAQGTSRRAEDRLPPGRIFHAGALKVAIPFEATYLDVMELVNQLTTFASTQMPAPATA